MFFGLLATPLDLRNLTRERDFVNTLRCQISIVESAKIAALIANVSTQSGNTFNVELSITIPLNTSEEFGRKLIKLHKKESRIHWRYTHYLMFLPNLPQRKSKQTPSNYRHSVIKSKLAYCSKASHTCDNYVFGPITSKLTNKTLFRVENLIISMMTL